jgi:hypothetical protein
MGLRTWQLKLLKGSGHLTVGAEFGLCTLAEGTLHFIDILF